MTIESLIHKFLIFESAKKNPYETSAYLGIELKVPVKVGRIKTAIEYRFNDK